MTGSLIGNLVIVNVKAKDKFVIFQTFKEVFTAFVFDFIETKFQSIEALIQFKTFTQR